MNYTHTYFAGVKARSSKEDLAFLSLVLIKKHKHCSNHITTGELVAESKRANIKLTLI